MNITKEELEKIKWQIEKLIESIGEQQKRILENERRLDLLLETVITLKMKSDGVYGYSCQNCKYQECNDTEPPCETCLNYSNWKEIDR